MYLNRHIQIGVEVLSLPGERYPAPVRRKAISRAMRVSEDFLRLVIWNLRTAGLVERDRDLPEMFPLARPSAQILLQEASDALDQDRPLRRGPLAPTVQALSLTAGPDLIWAGIGGSIRIFLENLTVADLGTRGASLDPAMQPVFARMGGVPVWRQEACQDMP